MEKITVDSEDAMTAKEYNKINNEFKKIYKSYVSQHYVAEDTLEAYNKWVEEGIKDQLLALNFYNEAKDLYIKIESIHIASPVMKTEGNKNNTIPMYPDYALKNAKSYSASVYATFAVIKVDENDKIDYSPSSRTQMQERVKLFDIPVMVGSKLCPTYNLSDKESRSVGVNPRMKGGYFIITGNKEERANTYYIPNRDRLKTNQIRMEEIKIPNITRKIPSVTQNTPTYFSSTRVSIMKDNDVYVFYSGHFGKKEDSRGKNINRNINIFDFIDIMFKSSQMNYDTDNVFNLFIDIVHSFCSNEGVKKETVSTELMLTFVKKKNNKSETELAKWLTKKGNPTEYQAEQAIFDFIDKSVLPKAEEIKTKIIMFGYMVARYILFLEYPNKFGFNDKNDMENRAYETAVSLFEKALRKNWIAVYNKFNNDVNGSEQKSISYMFSWFKNTDLNKISSITNAFNYVFIGTNNGPGGDDKKAEYIEFTNTVGFLSLMTKIVSPSNPESRDYEIRSVNPTSQYYICPVKTPENAKCGINNYKAMTTQITAKFDIDLRSFDVFRENKKILHFKDESHQNPIFINGVYYGWCDGPSLRNELLRERRQSNTTLSQIYIPRKTGITFNRTTGILDIYTIEGRMIVPMIVLKNGDIPFDEENQIGFKSVNQMIQEGIIDFVDSYEAKYSNIASDIKDLNSRKVKISTYKHLISNKETKIDEKQYEISEYNNQNIIDNDEIEKINEILSQLNDDINQLKYEISVIRQNLRIYIEEEPEYIPLHPSMIMGVAASTIVYANHTMATRNTYQAKMITQAIQGNDYYSGGRKGLFALSNTNPLISTCMFEALGLDENPIGKLANVAFMSWSMTQEDAIVMSSTFAEELLFVKSYKFTSRRIKNIGEKFGVYGNAHKLKDDPFRHIIKNGSKTGLPIIGSRVEPGDVIIGKYKSSPGEDQEDLSIKLSEKEYGYVTSAVLENDIVTVIISRKEIPKVGDKFSFTPSQKNTVGIIVNFKDMPEFQGSVPDIIISQHSPVSRMTPGFIREIFMGIVAAQAGVQFDATAYNDYSSINSGVFSDFLVSIGFKRSGEVPMKINGELVGSGSVLFGPAYIKQLHHLSEDKIQSQPAGKRDINTMQAKDAVRVGIQSFNVIRALMASHLCKEKQIQSDIVATDICENCGYYNTGSFEYGPCIYCKEETKKYIISIPYAFLAFQKSHVPLGIHPKILFDKNRNT